MKKLFKLVLIALFGFCLVLTGCSRDQDTGFSSLISSKAAEIIIVP